MIKYEELERNITDERLKTYLDFVNNDKVKAIELYEWNTKISESLYIPLSYFEVVLRNVCNEKLKKELGKNWYLNAKILSGNNAEKGQWALDRIEEAKSKIQKRKLLKKILDQEITLGDIVSNLEFSFWSNLFCANYEFKIWLPYLRPLFHNKNRKDLFKKIDSIRELRNRIFHYEPILFNNNPEEKYNLIIDLLCTISSQDICNHVRSISNFEKIFQEYKNSGVY
ncbi:MAG TPA: Abi family protein [Rickettsiales bacterium]|nr:Abi family protein [Rickettsiales bacterium]